MSVSFTEFLADPFDTTEILVTVACDLALRDAKAACPADHLAGAVIGKAALDDIPRTRRALEEEGRNKEGKSKKDPK